MDRELLEFFNRPVLEKGDLIFEFGRHKRFGWHFFGIPSTRFTPAIGVSYYVVRGDEDATTTERLISLVR